MNNQDEGPPKTKMPFDPGWNDPPTLSFNPQTASKPRNLLNKRVAFPMNTQNQAMPPVVPTSPPNLPPLPQVYNSKIPPLPINLHNTSVTVNTTFENSAFNPENATFKLSNTALNPVNTAVHPANTSSGMSPEDEVGDTVIGTDELLTEVSSIMNELLERNSELGPKLVDIGKRLQTMEDMWKENKLNHEIHIKMKQLANALKCNKLEEAENIQKALMVDHVSSVSSWMVGIRQLIHYCQAKEELMKIDQSEER